MKPQDILFFVVFLVLLYKHNPKYFALAGLICIAASIPLFAFWIFFTAERLTWYAGGFLLASIVLLVINELKSNSHSGAK